MFGLIYMLIACANCVSNGIFAMPINCSFLIVGASCVFLNCFCSLCMFFFVLFASYFLLILIKSSSFSIKFLFQLTS